MEELGPLMRTQQEYQECSIMCFTVTWLEERIPDSIAVHGSGPYEEIEIADRAARVKKKALQCLSKTYITVGVTVDLLLRKSISASEVFY